MAARRDGRSRPRDPRDYDAVLVFGGAMHADQEERHPWLREEKALLRELLERGVPLLGVCLGAQLLAEAAGASARRASAPGDRLARRRGDRRGRTGSGAGPARAALHGVPVAQLRVHAAARRHAARAQRRLPAGLPARQRNGHPVPRRGHAPRTPRRGSTTTAPTRTPSGSASTRMRCGAETRAVDRRVERRSGAPCASASWLATTRA